jgi:lipoprotein NlpI
MWERGGNIVGMEEIEIKNTQASQLLDSITFVMFKESAGKKIHEFKLNAISEHHAITVAEQFYKKNGFIGRYYCETENGKMFQINW